jgi:hypothetical protein
LTYRVICPNEIELKQHTDTPERHNITHESNKDAEQLYDVCVSDAVKTSEKCVDNGDAGAEDHARPVVHIDDDAERGACETSHIIIKQELQ